MVSSSNSLLLEGSNAAAHSSLPSFDLMNDNQNPFHHPVLSPIGYHLDLSAIQPLAPSPSPERTISPTSHSEVYASSQHSSIGIPALSNPLSWNHPASGTGLPDELNSPKPSPVQYTSHLSYPHPSSGVNTPFISAVHSPATGSPALHMTTLLPEQTSYPSSHPLESYQTSSAGLGLRSQEELQGASRRGDKRAHEDDSLETGTPVKRPRGRPPKDSLPEFQNQTFNLVLVLAKLATKMSKVMRKLEAMEIATLTFPPALRLH
ncbi:hypothetical protein F5876DRAFT_69947 [Lentinula aff. lateritia]|uniref:Uncharacterized protein n=1 Tax=Lentinula aff. lateritia TaxID=2804960 RepID=A0ACC1TKX7_9AGAR|nr:hypothetical protein F5876DRAFT_69947 [Lentinula aff. lateritia]